MRYILVFLLLSCIASAQDLEVPVTAEGLCQSFQDIRDNKDPNQKKNSKVLLFERLKVLLFPGKFSKPEVHSIKADDPSLLQKSTDGTRHIIVSLAPLNAQNADLDKYKKESEEIKKIAFILKDLAKQKSVSECLARINEIQFDLVQSEAVIRSWFSKDAEKRVLEEREVAEDLRRFRERSRIKWEYISGGDLDVVHKLINDSSVRSLVVISHGQNNGKLIDSQNDVYPTKFFEDISPSVQTLAFYSCYSNLIDSIYGISTALRTKATHHPVRNLITVDHKNFLSSENAAPLNGFISFLSRVESTVLGSVKASNAYQKKNKDQLRTIKALAPCSYSTEGVDVKKGRLALFSGNSFIGMLRSGTLTGKCLDKPNYLISGINLKTSPEVQTSNAKLIIKGQQIDRRLENYREFRSHDGEFRSLLFN